MLLTNKSEHIHVLSNYVFSKRKNPVSNTQIRIRRMRWATRVQAWTVAHNWCRIILSDEFRVTVKCDGSCKSSASSLSNPQYLRRLWAGISRRVGLLRRVRSYPTKY